MTNEPILVVSGSIFFSMIDTDGTNAILVNGSGIISTAAFGSLVVVDPNIFLPPQFAANNPPNTP